MMVVETPAGYADEEIGITISGGLLVAVCISLFVGGLIALWPYLESKEFQDYYFDSWKYHKQREVKLSKINDRIKSLTNDIEVLEEILRHGKGLT